MMSVSAIRQRWKRVCQEHECQSKCPKLSQIWKILIIHIGILFENMNTPHNYL